MDCKIISRLAFAVLATASFSASAVELHIAGDSTLHPRAADCNIQSWGDKLAPRLKTGNKLTNYAISGTSTVTFRKRWETDLLPAVKEGDFVIIQFGHNDQWHTEAKYAKPDVPDRFCTPAEFRTNITRMVREVKARKATPVILSTTPLGVEEKTGKFQGLSERKRPYMEALPEVAKAEQVDYLDMLHEAGRIFEAFGIERSRQLYGMAFGGTDNVHPSEIGAQVLAQYFLATVRMRKLSVAGLFK